MNFSRPIPPKTVPWISGLLFLATVILTIATRSASLHAGAKPKTVIKFATLAPDGSTWMKVMRSFDAELRQQTDNRVGFKFYPGGVQGDEMDVLRKIRNGQLHAGGFTGFGLGAIVSGFRAMELPFMYQNLGEVDYTRKKMDPYYTQQFEDKGFTILGWADVGFIYLYSDEPIRSPQDLQNAKVWTWSGDKLAAIFFKAFQISPIPLALPDVLTSLQMGVVNAVYAPPLACIALQWFTRVRYMTDVPITYGFGAMLVSNKIVKKLSADDATTLHELGEKYATMLIDKTRVQNRESIDIIQAEGVEIIQVDPAITEAFFALGRGAWKDGVGDLYPAELLDRVATTVEEYRANGEAGQQ